MQLLNYRKFLLVVKVESGSLSRAQEESKLPLGFRLVKQSHKRSGEIPQMFTVKWRMYRFGDYTTD